MNRLMEVLLVEDNPGDVRLTREALAASPIQSTLRVVHDGEEAVLFLRGQGAYALAPRPDLILLDFNLPKKDGSEVLAVIKADAHLRSIPVVVLTTSDAARDIERAYDLHANCYVTKPLELDRFLDVVRSVSEFWLNLVKLPEGRP